MTFWIGFLCGLVLGMLVLIAMAMSNRPRLPW